MLYRTLVRMIERGRTEGIEEKIDVFYAAGKLSDAEYAALMALLHPAGAADEGDGSPPSEAGETAGLPYGEAGATDEDGRETAGLPYREEVVSDA